MIKNALLILFLSLHLFCLAQNESDTSALFFEKKIKEAKGDKLLASLAHYEYAVFLDENNTNTEKAIDHLKVALQAAKSISNDTMIAKFANYMGGIYWVNGDCNSSTMYYEEALQCAIRSNNTRLESTIKMNLSGNYCTSGQNEKAIQYAIDALEINEQKHTERICYDYIMVAEIFQSIGNINKWKDYVHKAYVLKDDEHSAIMSDVVMIYNNLGRIAEYEKEYDTALAYYDTLMQVSKTAEYRQGMGISLLNSALVLQMQNKTDKALELTIESEQYFGEVPYFKMAVLNSKAELLQELGRNVEALALVTENSKNENMSLYPSIKQYCLNLLYELNFALENHQAAYNWNDTLRVYESKLREEENLLTIEELETKYQTEKKEQQITFLSAENKIKYQRIVLSVVVLISLSLILVLGVLLFYRNKKQNRQKQEILRQQLLRSQMNPHFLFNALGSIQNYMLNNNTKEAAGYLNNFASLTRAILDHSAAETVMLEDEIKALFNYVKLEQMRLQNSFSYTINYNESLEIEFIKIPPMLIQPFVENAIKHGLKNKDKGELKISIEDQDETLKVSILDNGKGFDESSVQNKEYKSMAMTIFKQRIRLLKKKYSKKADFKIISTIDKGTAVCINIPIIDL